MMGSQERQRGKTNSTKEPKMKSYKFCKPSLVTSLGIVFALLLSIRPAQAGYVVTLQQVGPNVVATGSGVINLEGLSGPSLFSYGIFPRIRPSDGTWIGATI